MGHDKYRHSIYAENEIKKTEIKQTISRDQHNFTEIGEKYMPDT